MLISPEEADQRLSSKDNLSNVPSGKVQNVGEHSTRFSRREAIIGDISVRPFWNGGRREGDVNVPQFIREVAACAAQTESSSSVAKNLGLSKSQVDQYKEGNITPGQKDPALSDTIDKHITSVRELAITKLMTSMTLMTDEKLGKLKATELSKIASDMSKVTSNVQKKDEKAVDRIIVFAPESKTELHYTTIEVNS